MTLHDATLDTQETQEAAIKVADWLEYYAPAPVSTAKGEQVSTSKLEILEQMYAYYDA